MHIKIKQIRVNKRFLIGLVMVFNLLLTGCAQSPVRNPFEGMRAQKLGTVPAVENPKASAKVVWADTFFNPTKGKGLPAKLVGDVLYVANKQGQLAALDKSTGRHLWHMYTNHGFSTGPAYLDGMLFFGTKDGKVVALDAHNGKEHWKVKVSTETLVVPNAIDGTVLVSTLDGALHALDARDGEFRWVLERGVPALILRGGSTPTIVDKTLLAGFSNGKLLAVDNATGQVKWERVVTMPHGRSELHRMVDITTAPVVQGDMVFVATYRGQISAVNWQTGALSWQRDIASYQDISVDEVAVYITDVDNNLWAIDGQTGATLWKQEAFKKRYITAPTLLKDTLVVGDRGGMVYWVNKQDGTLLADQKVADKLFLAPLVVDDVAILQGQNGKLTALKWPQGV